MWNDNQIRVRNISYGYIYMIYSTFSYYKHLDEDLKRFPPVVTVIAVTAAVTVPVLLVVGSVLSTRNG